MRRAQLDAVEARQRARKALIQIFNSVNKRREEVVRDAKLAHLYQGATSWSDVDMAKDGMSGSSAGLSLSEFAEALVFTACDAADGTVDGQWAQSVSALHDEKHGRRTKFAKKNVRLSVGDVVAAVESFFAERLTPLVSHASLVSFRRTVQEVAPLTRMLAELAPLHAQTYQRISSRSRMTGLVRVRQQRFVGFVTHRWAGTNVPSAEQANAAFGHVVHLSLYMPLSAKALSPHDFQEALLWLALVTTRAAHVRTVTARRTNRRGVLEQPTAAAIVGELLKLPKVKREMWLRDIRTALELGSNRAAEGGSVEHALSA